MWNNLDSVEEGEIAESSQSKTNENEKKPAKPGLSQFRFAYIRITFNHTRVEFFAFFIS